MPTNTPRGTQTSEFWLIVATLILTLARAVATAFGLHFSPGVDAEINIATALPAIYAALRTWLKINVPTIGNELPDLTDGPAAPSSPSAGAIVEQPALDQSTQPQAGTPVQVVPIISVAPSPFIGADAPAA